MKAKATSRAQATLKARAKAQPATVRMLSGDNPQIPMGEGDAPVQAYIAAVPGWKQQVCQRLDAVITKTLPGVRKVVKWNTPMYGLDGRGYCIAFHMFTRYVKVTFFEGASLKPMPPGVSKVKGTRYLDIHEHDTLDEAQLAKWIRQASKLPGFLAPRS